MRTMKMKLISKNVFLWLSYGLLTFCTSVGGVTSCNVKANLDTWYSTVWENPSVEPQLNEKKQAVISGAMPIGNGEISAQVFPLTHALHLNSSNDNEGYVIYDGISLIINMAEAMSSDTSMFKLGIVTIRTVPSMFSSPTPKSFCQTLNILNGSITISTDVARVISYVDPETNVVEVVVEATDEGTSFDKVEVFVQSLRPQKRFQYDNFLFKDPATSSPDVILPIEYISKKEKQASIGIYHRNKRDDIPHDVFNLTLRQQGLSHIIDDLQFLDFWKDRQFGMAITGSDGEKSFGISKDKKDENTLVLTSSQITRSCVIRIYCLSEQTQSSDEWINRIREIIQNDQNLYDPQISTLVKNNKRLKVLKEYWAEFWEKSWVRVSSSKHGMDASFATALTRKYAGTRYLQSIQTHDWIPIKFNGQQFTANLPPTTMNSGPDHRQWGVCSWWQNTRFPYLTMLPTGDFANYESIIRFFSRNLPFNTARTMSYFNHTGTFYSETKTLFGAYRPLDYRYSKAGANLPVWLMESPWTRLDFGGDGGTLEIALMVLDLYLYTGNVSLLRKYLPIVVAVTDFYRQHYADDTGAFSEIFPTQALETYWCGAFPFNKSNCPTNDHPTIAGLHSLVEKLLALPKFRFIKKEQRNQWRKLKEELPSIPMTQENGHMVVSPYSGYPDHDSGVRNSEAPELYSTHPFRIYTLARNLTRNAEKMEVNLDPSIFCMRNSSRKTCKYSKSNTGWNQGILNAALLGLTDLAAEMLLSRVKTAPAKGYRLDYFAPHFQDYEPSADHYAVMMTAVNSMLLQVADDAYENSSFVLFPTWPCMWDIDFKLWAPNNTYVQGTLKDGHLVSLKVEPKGQAKNMLIHRCHAKLSVLDHISREY